MSRQNHTIKTTISQIEPNFVTLKTEFGEIRLPRENLPENLNVGQEISLKILTPEIEEQEEYKNKKKLLTELIN